MTLRTQRVRTLEQVRAFLDGSEAVDFAGVDEQLGQMSGAATRKVLRRQWQVFGDPRFERLSELSNGHLYNLRKSRTYRNVRRVWTRTSGSVPVDRRRGLRRGLSGCPGVPAFRRRPVELWTSPAGLSTTNSTGPTTNCIA